MRHIKLDTRNNEIAFIGRILLMLLWVIYGWIKLTNFSATVSAMASFGMPLPWLSALIAVLMELVVGVAILLGICYRPLAFALALYTLATALIGHHFWTIAGQARADEMETFFKNISIMGGLLILSGTTPVRYSFDRSAARRNLNLSSTKNNGNP